MRKYKDPKLARKWFDWREPCELAGRKYFEAKSQDPNNVEDALKRLTEASDDLSNLLGFFGVSLGGHGSGGWDGHINGLQFWGKSPFSEEECWLMDHNGYVRVDASTWFWLRPLLLELRNFRNMQNTLQERSAEIEQARNYYRRKDNARKEGQSCQDGNEEDLPGSGQGE